MVSGFWFGVLCVFCLVVVPTVWAEYCTSYWDINNDFHDVQECSKYCCGNCYERYCCSSKSKHITLQQQEQCPQSTPKNSINIGMILGIIAGAILFIVICVILICCISPCCLIYKKRRNKLNQRQTTAPNTTVHTPPPPQPSTGHQPTHQRYQSVPGYEGPPTPTAPPPSYLECTAPGYPGGVFTQEQPMYPLQPPSQPTAPPHSNEAVHSSHNPSDGTDP